MAHTSIQVTFMLLSLTQRVDILGVSQEIPDVSLANPLFQNALRRVLRSPPPDLVPSGPPLRGADASREVLLQPAGPLLGLAPSVWAALAGTACLCFVALSLSRWPLA